MSYYPTDGRFAADRRPLAVGNKVLLADDPNQWTVAAVSDHFAALTRPATALFSFEDDAVLYTVLDWRNGVRGPCNLSGQGWGDGTYSPDECAQMLAEFEAGNLTVSQRNWVRIRFAHELKEAVR